MTDDLLIKRWRLASLVVPSDFDFVEGLQGRIFPGTGEANINTVSHFLLSVLKEIIQK